MEEDGSLSVLIVVRLHTGILGVKGEVTEKADSAVCVWIVCQSAMTVN